MAERVANAKVEKREGHTGRLLTWVAAVSVVAGAVWCLAHDEWWGAATLLAAGGVLALVAFVWTGDSARAGSRHGRHTPTMWPLSVTVVTAVFSAIGVIAGAVWLVMVVGGISLDRTPDAMTATDLLPAAIAVLSPVAALVAAVFVYRRAKMALAGSHRADEEQYQKRFVDAANLLGNDNASVRVAGVIAMATLARDWDDERQRCVDVLCGYLRVPPKNWQWNRAKDTTPPPIPLRGENEVRNTLVAELTKLLKDKAVIAATPIWLNLRGAVFGNVAYFSEATFAREATFEGAAFTGVAIFEGTRFAGDANFRGAAFTGVATFTHAMFIGTARFDRATFSDTPSFAQATFTHDTHFWQTTFTRDAHFMLATFSGDVVFWDATFVGAASFAGATFSKHLTVAGKSILRDPLGPLRAGSSLPNPPGKLVHASGRAAGKVKWL